MDSKSLVYVGKRSRILKTIYSLLPEGNVISFKEAYTLHIKDGLIENKLVLFSLPEKNNINEYFEFIKNVKCIFLINISSTCIYSRYHYDDSFFKKVPKYVYIKSTAHKLTNERYNSKNIILGILDQKAPFPNYPFSDNFRIASDLKNTIKNFNDIKRDNLYSFDILRPKVNKYRFIPYYLRIIMRKFPYGIPLCFDFLYKILKLKARFYTCMSSFQFIDNLRIGDGAFGTASASSNEVIFFSGRRTAISSNDCLNTFTGYEQIGLDKYRNGVRTFVKNGKIFKEWILAPRIRNIFRNAYEFHVEEINWHEENKFFEVICKKFDDEVVFFVNKIKLAAGTLENTRLSMNISNDISYQEIQFSDHFNTCIGKVNFDEILNKGYLLTTFLPFIFVRNNLIPINKREKNFGFAEFRINTDSKNKLVAVFKKILSYIFNRTGIVFLKPSNIDVWVQLTTENMIGVELNDNLKNNLILIPYKNSNLIDYREKLINLSIEQLKIIFNSFETCINPFFPNHHLWGGGRVLDSELIKKLLEEGNLKICGSPSKEELGPFHHTIRIAKILRKEFN